MKAYVIKNKEGEYFITNFGKPMFSKEIADAYIDTDKQNLDCIIIDNSFKDCTIVSITMAEGDLEEENRVLKKERELVKSVIQSIYNGGQTYCMLPNGKEIVGDMGYIIDFYADVCKNYPELENIFGKQGDER